MQQENNHMAGRALSIKVYLMLILFALPLRTVAQQPYENWDTGSDELIHKEIVTHRITSQDLIDLITEYDNMYSEFIDDPQMGLTIFCRISDKTITYTVVYAVGIGQESSVILCEPVNGREVYILIFDMHRQLQLPHPRSVELLKKSNPKLYDSFRRAQRQAELEEGKPLGPVGIIVTFDFVSWKITFDKFTGEVVSTDKRDLTKQYRKHYKKYPKSK